MKVVFLGYPVPAKFLTKTVNTNYSAADNIAQDSLISGLFENNQDDPSVITAAANFDTPAILNGRTRRVHVKLDCGITAAVVANLNYGKSLYYLSLMWTYTTELLRVFRANSDARNVLVITSGPHIFTVLPVLAARAMRRVCFIPFLIGAATYPTTEASSASCPSFRDSLFWQRMRPSPTWREVHRTTPGSRLLRYSTAWTSTRCGFLRHRREGRRPTRSRSSIPGRSTRLKAQTG